MDSIIRAGRGKGDTVVSARMVPLSFVEVKKSQAEMDKCGWVQATVDDAWGEDTY